MRTKIGALVALAGAVLLVWGIARTVSDGAHPTVEATLPASQAGYVMTEPGVLDLVNTKVHVEARGGDGDTDVTVALGSSEDVSAWVDGLAVVRVTGLDTWETLAGAASEATVEETPSVSGSDLWTRVESGKGGVSFDYEVTDPGATSLVARTSAGTAPELVLTWQRPDSTGAGVPLSIVGLLVAAIGAVLVAMGRKDPDGLPALLAKLTKGRSSYEAIPAVEAAKAAKKDAARGGKADAATMATPHGAKGAGAPTRGKETAQASADPAGESTGPTGRVSLFAKDTAEPGTDSTRTEGTK